MTFIYSQTSESRRAGVHPKLILVSNKALEYGLLDMMVLPDGGVRTPERQQQLVASGKSKTLLSKHLKQDDGYGHAIDLAPFPVDWDDIEQFKFLGALMFRAAMELGIEIEWGGMWPTFKDYPHFQLKEK